MFKKAALFVLVLSVAAFSLSIVSAQEVTETPAAPEAPVEVQTSLEDLTANPANYYATEVTVEGTIEDLLNVRTFVLGEAAAIDDDKVLVINNTGIEFDLRVAATQQVRLTGTVYPSITEGGLAQLMSGDSAISTPEPMGTDEVGVDVTEMPEMNMEVGDAVVDFSAMSLPEDMNGFTIIVLDSLESMTFIEQQ